jgi:hypothetical protein
MFSRIQEPKATLSKHVWYLWSEPMKAYLSFPKHVPVLVMSMSRRVATIVIALLMLVVGALLGYRGWRVRG